MMKLYFPTKPQPGQTIPAINQAFGVNPQNYAKFNLKGHNGLDFYALMDTPIYAVHDGIIIEAENPGKAYGLLIQQMFSDGDKFYRCIYGHLDQLEIPQILGYQFKSAETVTAGAEIAKSGGNPTNPDGTSNDKAGNSSGPHLHLGLYECNSSGNILNINNGFGGAIDPYPYLINQGEEKTMNTYVKTINLDGEVAAYIPLSDSSQVDLLNKIFNLNLVVGAGGVIPTDIQATRK